LNPQEKKPKTVNIIIGLPPSPSFIIRLISEKNGLLF